MEFQILKIKRPGYAEALENHLREHKQIAEMEERQKALAQMQDMNPQM